MKRKLRILNLSQLDLQSNEFIKNSDHILILEGPAQLENEFSSFLNREKIHLIIVDDQHLNLLGQMTPETFSAAEVQNDFRLKPFFEIGGEVLIISGQIESTNLEQKLFNHSRILILEDLNQLFDQLRLDKWGPRDVDIQNSECLTEDAQGGSRFLESELQEFYELICCLFPKSSSIKLERLNKDKDEVDTSISFDTSTIGIENNVVKVSEHLVNQYSRYPLIIKFATKYKILKEKENYAQYIERSLSAARFAKIYNVETLWDKGAIAYLTVGHKGERAHSFAYEYLNLQPDKLYKQMANSSEGIPLQQVIRDFFENIWKNHYDQAEETEPTTRRKLSEEYDEVWSSGAKDGASWIKNFLNNFYLGELHQLAENTPTGIKFLLYAKYRHHFWGSFNLPIKNFIHYFEQSQGKSTLKSKYTFVGHGDLHADNILVDKESPRAWILDFERTGRCPLVLDFVELEVDIVSRLLFHDIKGDQGHGEFDVQQLIIFFIALTDFDSNSEDIIPPELINVDPHSIISDQLQKAHLIIITIREIASEYFNDKKFSAIEYYWGLLMNIAYVLNVEIKRKNINGYLINESEDQRANILMLYGSVICERLSSMHKKNPTWPPPYWNKYLSKIDKTHNPSGRTFVSGCAVIIGVEHFPIGRRDQHDVRYVIRNNAEIVQKTLIKKGGYKKDHIVTLIDKDETTANHIKSSLMFMAQKAKNDSDIKTCMFYFCGHSFYDSERQEYGIIPSDTKKDIKKNLIYVSELEAYFKIVQQYAENLLIIFDCAISKSNNLKNLTSISQDLKSESMDYGALNLNQDKKTVCIVTSCEQGQISNVDIESKLTIFTKQLVSCFNGAVENSTVLCSTQLCGNLDQMEHFVSEAYGLTQKAQYEPEVSKFNLGLINGGEKISKVDISNSRSALRNIIAQVFEPVELRALCFDLIIDTGDFGDGKTNFIIKLIEYFEQRGQARRKELKEYLQKARPNVDWNQFDWFNED